VLDQFYPAPPWRWSERRALWRYWVRDALAGAGDIAIHHLLRLLATDRISAIGARLGARAGRKRLAASERARAALRLLRPEASEAEIEALLTAHWRHVGRVFAEFAAHDRILPERRIAIEGGEIPLGILRAGRPLIIAGTHVGSWETVPGALLQLGIPVQVIFQALPNRFRMRIAARSRARSLAAAGVAGSGVILPGLGAPFEALRVLEERSAALVYYVDEDWGGRVQAPALGRPIRMEGNIMRVVRLARRSGAAVVPALGLRLGDAARYRVTFLPEVRFAGVEGRQGIRDDIAALDAAIAPLVRAHPEQWFMLHAWRG
jgi:KDO2-lipid IV(A) lauroyltransferase